jgi:hypothetical protein
VPDLWPKSFALALNVVKLHCHQEVLQPGTGKSGVRRDTALRFVHRFRLSGHEAERIKHCIVHLQTLLEELK